MNNFNPDQNPHILSSPENPEEGTGGSNVPPNQAEQGNSELRGEVLEGREGLETAGQSNVEGRDEAITFNLESFDTLINKTASDLELTDKPPFELDPETGLSLQGKQIEDLRAQLEALENDESTKLDVSSEIESNRIQERESLNNKLEQYKNIRTGLNPKIQAAINQSNRSIEDFISGNEELQDKVSELDQEIQKAEKALNDFDAETVAQLEQAIQDKKTELQQQLTEAQAGYTESGAEANDKKVLLERQLQEQLTDPNQLFSSQNINQIFTIYGVKEGLAKLEALKQESDQAREQAARDEIRQDIISRVDLYNQIPELAEALSTDIQPKLEKLQESNPESDTIKEALTVERTVDKLNYLANSKDPQLQVLAFWFDRDSNIDQVVAEYPQFAQYLAKETDKRYEQQQQEIQSSKIDGQQYLGSKMDNNRRVEIDNRISAQLEIFRSTKIQELQGELSGLKFDENGRDYDTQDRTMLSEQEQLRLTDIEQFQTELQQALESGQIKFEQGKFSSVENILSKQQEINKQLETIFNQIQPVLEAAGYSLQSLESLSSILDQINTAKQKAANKLFGFFGKAQSKALESLATEVTKTIEKYDTLQADKQKNADQFENNNQSISKLRESYQKLPQSIQKSLSSLQNPNLDTINQTIDSGVESIQNYQTPPEIAEKRSQIQAIESQIAETQAITAPTASIQSSL